VGGTRNQNKETEVEVEGNGSGRLIENKRSGRWTKKKRDDEVVESYLVKK